MKTGVVGVGNFIAMKTGVVGVGGGGGEDWGCGVGNFIAM